VAPGVGLVVLAVYFFLRGLSSTEFLLRLGNASTFREVRLVPLKDAYN
jgi:hypothetical protein